MKTEELIDDIREHLQRELDLPDDMRSQRLEATMKTAADRLESILKAWEEADRVCVFTEDSQLQPLRRAITGDPS